MFDSNSRFLSYSHLDRSFAAKFKQLIGVENECAADGLEKKT